MVTAEIGTAAYIGITVAAIVANGAIAAADLAGARFVLANSAAVGVPASWIKPLGLLKGAGALGLLVGLLGVPIIGTAAAVGLLLFFAGAIGAHLRAGDRSASLAFPAAFALLALGSSVLGVAVA